MICQLEKRVCIFTNLSIQCFGFFAPPNFIATAQHSFLGSRALGERWPSILDQMPDTHPITTVIQLAFALSRPVIWPWDWVSLPAPSGPHHGNKTHSKRLMWCRWWTECRTAPNAHRTRNRIWAYTTVPLSCFSKLVEFGSNNFKIFKWQVKSRQDKSTRCKWWYRDHAWNAKVLTLFWTCEVY